MYLRFLLLRKESVYYNIKEDDSVKYLKMD